MNLIDHLPPDSYYVEACYLDEEYMTLLAEKSAGQEKKPYKPRQAYESEEASRLGELITRVDTLTAVVVGALGGNAGKVEPYPRPDILVKRPTDFEDRWKAHEELVAKVMAAQGK